MTKQRIVFLDSLRGFALFGILFAHMLFWYTGASLPKQIYEFQSTLDIVLMAIFGTFFLSKFFSIFSFLFGVGFYLQTSRIDNKKGLSRYIVRLLVLSIIGLLHHLLWKGDILIIYALLGLLLIPIRRLNNTAILLLAIILMLNIPSRIWDVLRYDETPSSEIALPLEERAKEYQRVIEYENFLSVLEHNVRGLPEKFKFQLDSGRLIITFGYFLIGFYAGRNQWFQDSPKRTERFATLFRSSGIGALILLLIGWALTLLDLLALPQLTYEPNVKWILEFLLNLFNTAVTFFYITGFYLLHQQPGWKNVTSLTAPAGRMALSNYLLQTFFGLALFYSIGLHLFLKTSLLQNALLTIAVFAVQLAFSRWWLTRYEQGPAEAIWRSVASLNFRVPGSRKSLRKILP